MVEILAAIGLGAKEMGHWDDLVGGDWNQQLFIGMKITFSTGFFFVDFIMIYILYKHYKWYIITGDDIHEGHRNSWFTQL